MTFWGMINAIVSRLLGVLEELVNTRTILAILSVGGFFFIVNKVVDRLVDPPASELFAILNLVLALAMAASAYYFGYKAGESKSSNGE